MLENGRLKPGIYKIQNLDSDTYLDVHRHTKELCCRPARNIEDGEGLWEIKRLGAWYTVQKFEPGGPEQFCTSIHGVNGGTSVYATDYPVAWRIEAVNNGSHRGFRFYWGSTRKTWDLHNGDKGNGTKVHFHDDAGHTRQTWRLIPARVEGMFTTHTPGPRPAPTPPAGPDTLPPYDDRNQTCAFSHRTTEATTNDDELGTTVVEVTVTTTTNTVTTRKKYRVEGD